MGPLNRIPEAREEMPKDRAEAQYKSKEEAIKTLNNLGGYKLIDRGDKVINIFSKNLNDNMWLGNLNNNGEISVVYNFHSDDLGYYRRCLKLASDCNRQDIRYKELSDLDENVIGLKHRISMLQKIADRLEGNQ